MSLIKIRHLFHCYNMDVNYFLNLINLIRKEHNQLIIECFALISNTDYINIL